MNPLIAITTELTLARVYELRGFPSMATERRAIALDMMRAFPLPDKEVLLEN